MSKSNKSDEVLFDVEQSLSKAENFVENNQKTLIIVVGALLLIIGGYFGYNKLYLAPMEKEAQVELFKAQEYFSQDSLNLALNGLGNTYGFLTIIDEYGPTKAANLSKYYAGICYLNLGEFEEAIRYLDQFKSSDENLSIISEGAIGDAFLELGQPEEALDYYLKAANKKENKFLNPVYLMRAAQVAELHLRESDPEQALKLYTRIKEEYPDSREASDIDKYIARANAKTM